MQLQTDKANKMDEVKTEFKSREGLYKLMNSPDYSQRSQRAMGFSSNGTTTGSNVGGMINEKTYIKISLVTINNDNENSANINVFPTTSVEPEDVQNGLGQIGNQSSYPRSRGRRDKKICFNVGRELFVYNYDGVRRGPDASCPIYKRSYKGSLPTCHNFNQTTATSEFISLIVGFSLGQVQLIVLNGRLDQEHTTFNLDRVIDKTRVTCVKWLPNSPSLFLVSHASGHLYLYKDDLPCGNTPPVYQIYKQSEGVIIYTCKTKTTRNPIYKWTIGGYASSQMRSSIHSHTSEFNDSCSINEFDFSPCGKYLACVSQDGFLRVYCYDTMELIGRARSYYAGLSCVCWSPDGKYVVTGGEDDCINVWSFLEKRVVARGVGHKSWVTVVSFDPYYSGYEHDEDDTDIYRNNRSESDDDDYEDGSCDESSIKSTRDQSDLTFYDISHQRENDNELGFQKKFANLRTSDDSGSLTERRMSRTSFRRNFKSYRFGSAGQDTQLCLWDLNDDLISQPVLKQRSAVITKMQSTNTACLPTNKSLPASEDIVIVDGFIDNSKLIQFKDQEEDNIEDITQTQDTKPESNIAGSSKKTSSTDQKQASNSTFEGGSRFTSSFSKSYLFNSRKYGKRFLKSSNSDKSSNRTENGPSNSSCDNNSKLDDPLVLLGTPMCPRMNEVPILEPTICKKISMERLTSLIFCKGGFITACQDGFVFSWARPSMKKLKFNSDHSNEDLRVIDVGSSIV